MYIVHRSLDTGAVHVQRAARTAGLGEFEHYVPGPVALSDTHLPAIQPTGRQVLAQSAMVERVPLGQKFGDPFGRDQQQGLLRAPMNFRMRPSVAENALRGDDAFGDGALGNSTGRYVDLKNKAGQIQYYNAHMADADVPAPKRTSRRVLIFLIVLVAAFLAGLVPMWLKLRDQTALRLKAEHSLTITRIEKDLGSAAIDARRGEYEAARQEASAFFTAARFEIDERSRSALTQQQRDALMPLMASRDEMITLLARSDPASADRLANLYVALRKVLGV